MSELANPFTVELTEDDMKEAASYDDIEPGPYTGKLVSVTEIKANTGNRGHRWTFLVKGLEFSTATWLSGRGGWRLKEILTALGEEVAPGTLRISPQRLIGRTAVVKLGYDKSSNRPDFLTVLRVMPQAERPTIDDLVDMAEAEEAL